MQVKKYYTSLSSATSVFAKFKNIFKRIYKRALITIERKPLLSFFSILSLLFAFIIIGNILRSPPPIRPKAPIIKEVSTYQIGAAPKIILNGQVEKSGVISITSIMGGVVQNIYVKEGDRVYKGQWLIGLSTNYQGGNALTLARQLAQKQNQLVEDNYPSQKDLIRSQKDLANEQINNADKIRDITSKSIDDTQNLINLNGDIISTLDANISGSEASSSGNPDLILTMKQMKSQFESANLQLNNSIRNARYQSDANSPVNNLGNINKDIALKQLDIQDKALDLNREISKIQLQLAEVNEASMYPSAPFAGTVEKIQVKEGQNITAGSLLTVLSGTKNAILKVTVLTTKDIAQKVSRLEESSIRIGSKTIQAFPDYVSHEAVQNDLYSIIYQLPNDQYQNATDKSLVSVEVPVGYPDTPSSVPYVPMDAVYQTEEGASIFVMEKGKAVNRPVKLATVTGRYVQVSEGLSQGDTVILDRNIVAQDLVSAK